MQVQKINFDRQHMITIATLKDFAAAGSISHVCASGVPGGFLLLVTIGLKQTPINAYRGQARLFKMLDT